MVVGDLDRIDVEAVQGIRWVDAQMLAVVGHIHASAEVAMAVLTRSEEVEDPFRSSVGEAEEPQTLALAVYPTTRIARRCSALVKTQSLVTDQARWQLELANALHHRGNVPLEVV